MKFGVREICDVVLKAKAAMKIGNKVFYKNEPVIYFDSLKTSSMEGAATTVYAQGGRGNSRLVAWEGERTVTFTMEDALISPEGFMILSGAGLVEASANKKLYQHIAETTDEFSVTDKAVWVEKKPHLSAVANDNLAYVMVIKNGEVSSEPFVVASVAENADADGAHAGKFKLTIGEIGGNPYSPADFATEFEGAEAVLVDYYVEQVAGARQIEITADKFGGNYYLEASTLFRDTNGVDMPAEFIIPNCKIQSNFNFTMASSGDPSTFTFTMDAFPDYTRFDHSKKVLAAIQMIDAAGNMDIDRTMTNHDPDHDKLFK